MAEQHALTDSGVTAAASLATNQFQGVKIVGNRSINVVAASTDIPHGILQNKPASGQAAEVAIAGLAKVQLGATLTAGAEFMFNGSAVAIASATAGNRIVGYLLEGGASGDIVACHLYGTPYPHP